MADNTRKRVFIRVQFEAEYARRIARGIMAYAKEHTNWQLWHSRFFDGEEIVASKTNGFIGQAMPPQCREAMKAGLAVVVIVGTWDADADIPTVGVDDRAVGAMAAEYLIERGLKHFAFVGNGGWLFVGRRRDGFDEALRRHGLEPSRVFIGSPYARHERIRFEKSLTAWLGELPSPCGILAANDATGVEVIAGSRHAGLRVPDDLVVVGVDDDEMECELSEVPLSSVVLPLYAIGYEAAGQLDRVLKQPRIAPTHLLLPPVRVVTRASSDIMAVEDQEVAHTLQLIRNHATEPIGVDWLVGHLPITRRALERRFKRATGRTLLEQLQQSRFEKARELLAETDLPLKAITRQSGFPDMRSMITAFHRRCGQSPAALRTSLRSRRMGHGEGR